MGIQFFYLTTKYVDYLIFTFRGRNVSHTQDLNAELFVNYDTNRANIIFHSYSTLKLKKLKIPTF